MDNVLTMLLLAGAGVLVLCSGHPTEEESFLSLPYTQAMKGLACIVVLMVHVPDRYGNPIQDAAGSFAYVFVTLYFLFSGYGCRYSLSHKPDYLNHFWRRRLPHLLLPGLAVNTLYVVFGIALRRELDLLVLVKFSPYIYAILAAYGIFYLAWRIPGVPERGRDMAAVLGIAACSLLTRLTPIKVFFLWPTESLGFVWGLILFHRKDRVVAALRNHGNRLTFLLGTLSLGAGLLYLKTKEIFFVGDYLLKVLLAVLILGFVAALTYRFDFTGRLLLGLGKISYAMYLSHTLVMEALEYLAPELSSWMFIWLSLLLSILTATAVQVLSDRTEGRIQRMWR